jgi:uncharacterized protein (DUF58 family)
MASTINTLDPQSVARLEGLELRARYIMDGLLSGRHRSAHRGQSVEFAEHREYAPGDDLRYVDWKVFGKSDRVFLKQFDAETSLSCYLVLDVSESMSYQGPAAALSKLDYAKCIAAAVGHLVMRQRDAVGLATIDGDVRDFLPASSSAANLDRLVHLVERAGARGKSNLDAALTAVANRLRRRSLIVLVSDLLGGSDAFAAGLRKLRHARHEVLVVHTLDPAEIEFPFDRATLFRGLEALPDVLAEPHGVRKSYLGALDRFFDHVRGACRNSQSDYQLARTDAPLDVPLRELLTTRLRRRA